MSSLPPKTPSQFPSEAPALLAESQLLRRHTSYGNADVYVYEQNAKKYLVKTFASHPPFARVLFGGTIKNEYQLLLLLNRHCPGLAPQVYALIDTYTIVMEFIEGSRPLLSRRHYEPGSLPPPEFFRQLMESLTALHKAGFAHGDFRRANLLIAADGTPRLIDWGTGHYQHPQRPGNWLLRKMHQWRRRSDLFSLVSITESYYQDIIPAELKQYAQPGKLLRWARFLRRHLYRHGIKRWFKHG